MRTALLLALCTVNICQAQNLVPNPDFESTNGTLCGIFGPNEFTTTANDWSAPSQGTPDLFFTNIDPACWNYQTNSTYPGPIGLKGPQAPRSGNVMSGIFAFTIDGMEQREYIQVPFDAPLNIGMTYVVEFYAAIADYTEFGTNQLGLHLSTQQISIGTDGVLNYTPQVLPNSAIMDTSEWVRVADTLTAAEAYEYLTIGNFSSDAQTPTTYNPGYNPQPGTYGAYYFIDDVRVERIQQPNVGQIELQANKKQLVKIVDTMGRETKATPNQLLLYIYSDGTVERIVTTEN